MILDLIYLTLIVCFIVDLSGFVDVFKEWLYYFLKGRKTPYKEYSFKPFDCSLCMTWWSGIVYLLFTGNLSVQNIFVVALFAYSAEIFSEFMYTIKHFFIYVIDKLKI